MKSAQTVSDSLELIVHYNKDNNLPLDGPWSLDPSVDAEIKDQYGITDASDLLSLAAGTEYFDCDTEKFSSTDQASDIAFKDPEKLQVELVEAFTVGLIPPSCAAGLFLVSGLHPVWGLRVARNIQRRVGLTDLEPNIDQYDTENFNTAFRVCFSLISEVFDTLTHLDSNESYGIESLADTIASNVKSTDLQSSGNADPPLKIASLEKDQVIDRASNFIADDLLDSVLIPAGVASRDGNYFRVDTDVVRKVDVGLQSIQ